MNKRQQNKIKTPGYFIKRLRDSKFAVLRVFQNYAIHDYRKWTVLVDPSNTSIFVTCYQSRNFDDKILFEFDDGGNFFPKNYSICTESIEVIVQALIDRGVPTMSESSPYYKQKETTNAK